MYQLLESNQRNYNEMQFLTQNEPSFVAAEEVQANDAHDMMFQTEVDIELLKRKPADSIDSKRIEQILDEDHRRQTATLLDDF